MGDGIMSLRNHAHGILFRSWSFTETPRIPRWSTSVAELKRSGSMRDWHLALIVLIFTTSNEPGRFSCRTIRGAARGVRVRSTAEILAADRGRRRPLAEGDVAAIGGAEFGIDAYIDPAFHKREVETVWARCWQVAAARTRCRSPGDYHRL
jgi:hypothetical protein